jgi:hypothetical protein
MIRLNREGGYFTRVSCQKRRNDQPGRSTARVAARESKAAAATDEIPPPIPPMIFGPWLEKSDSPNGRKSDRLIGIRVQVTWLELKAWWRKLRKK